MTAQQVYEQAIKPLSMRGNPTTPRLIINEVASDTAPTSQAGFDYLRRILPQIERITLTDQDLAGAALNAPQTG